MLQNLTIKHSLLKNILTHRSVKKKSSYLLFLLFVIGTKNAQANTSNISKCIMCRLFGWKYKYILSECFFLSFFLVCPTMPVQLLVPDPSPLFCSRSHLPVTRTSSNLIQQSCDVSVTRSIWFLIRIYERELRGELGVSCWPLVAFSLYFETQAISKSSYFSPTVVFRLYSLVQNKW